MVEGPILYITLGSMFVIGVILGGVAVFLFRMTMVNRQLRIAERKADRIVAEAESKSKDMLREAKQEADKARAAAGAEYRERRSELQHQESRLS